MPLRPLHLRAILSLIMLLPAANAIDIDIQLNERQRQESVQADCLALRRQGNIETPDANYRKGLCLVYGLGGTMQREDGLRLLRSAAEQGLVEAQVALADVLQSNGDVEQALQWYSRAFAAGDQRAGLRSERLRQRLPSAAVSVAPSDATREPGYHCHTLRIGQKWCHSSAD